MSGKCQHPVLLSVVLFCFSARGRVRGSRGDRRGGGSVFLIENPRKGGGGFHDRGRRGEGAGRVSAGNWGGGVNIFFRGEMPAKLVF